MSRCSDALLALVTLTLLIAISFTSGTNHQLERLGPAVAGVVGTVLVEVVLLRFRERTRKLWAQRRVRVAAVGCVLLGGGAAAAWGAGVAVAVLAWGLAGYLALLGGITVGELVADRR